MSDSSEVSKFLITRAAARTVEVRERKLFLRKPHFPKMLRHTADVDSTKIFGRSIGYNYQPSTILALFCS